MLSWPHTPILSRLQKHTFGAETLSPRKHPFPGKAVTTMLLKPFLSVLALFGAALRHQIPFKAPQREGAPQAFLDTTYLDEDIRQVLNSCQGPSCLQQLRKCFRCGFVCHIRPGFARPMVFHSVFVSVLSGLVSWI